MSIQCDVNAHPIAHEVKSILFSASVAGQTHGRVLVHVGSGPMAFKSLRRAGQIDHIPTLYTNSLQVHGLSSRCLVQ